MGGQGEADFDRSPLPRVAGDVRLAAEESSPIADSDKSESIGWDGIVIEALALVGDDQLQFGCRGVDRDSGRRLTAVAE